MGKIKRRGEVTAVLFDWDLTLAYAEGIDTYGERLQTLFQYAGLSYTVEEIEAAVRDYQINTGTIDQKAPESILQTRQNIADYYRQILVRLGYVNDNWRFYDQLYDVFAKVPIILYPDSLPILQTLKKRNLVLGIITNHSSLIRPVIHTQVGKYVSDSHVIISQDLQVYKPDPVIFRQATRQIDVMPENCLFVGDNLEVDAIGAVQQGGFGLGLWIDRETDTTSIPPLPKNVHRITSLSQIIQFV
ncbi:MAG: HAD family hydrolase [Ardenticatenaceae bacterium]|nr:HAD family hydrolase [Ardenticatenaceae bacterium]